MTAGKQVSITELVQSVQFLLCGNVRQDHRHKPHCPEHVQIPGQHPDAFLFVTVQGRYPDHVSFHAIASKRKGRLLFCRRPCLFFIIRRI